MVKELIPSTVDIEETQLEKLPEEEIAHPERMKIRTEQFEIRKSYEILINTAEWLIKKGKLKKEDCPVQAGPKRNLVNIQPKHRYGEDFRAPKRLSNGLYIETHWNTISCISNARRLLERFGYDRNTLEVK